MAGERFQCGLLDCCVMTPSSLFEPHHESRARTGFLSPPGGRQAPAGGLPLVRHIRPLGFGFLRNFYRPRAIGAACPADKADAASLPIHGKLWRFDGPQHVAREDA